MVCSMPRIARSPEAVVVAGDTYRLVFDLDGDRASGLRLFHVDERGECLIASTRYFGLVYESKDSEPMELAAAGPEVTEADGMQSIRLTCRRDDWIETSIEVLPQPDGRTIDVNVSATVLKPGVNRMGMRLFCVDCLTESERVRLMALTWSGWNQDGRGLFVFPRRLPGAPKQFTAIKDYTLREPMVIHTKEQGIAFNYPEAVFGATKELSRGTRIVGGWRMEFSGADCWDPDVDLKAREHAPAEPGIQPPRHSYATHVGNWASLMRRPELWVDFGNGRGFYHRGFFGVCRGKMDVSGTLEYDGPKCIGTGGDRLCELSWGGSANVLLAYTLYRHGEPWAIEKADAIMKGIVEFRPGGCQGRSGPLQGAWYNGWLVDEGRFSDRFGRDSVYTPDQGITNYFLGKCLLEGHSGEDRIVPMMEANCAYLETLEMPGGGVRFGIRPDGSTAIDRHEVSYDIYGGDMALAAGAAALSNLMTWRLTGKDRYREKALGYLDHQLAHIARNNWRFHGYDTYGTNSQGLSWHLIILSEFVRDGFDRAAAPAERTLRHLLAYQYPFDPLADRHTENEKPWGGEFRTRGTIPTGSTRHYHQDYLNGHHRYDPAEALWAYYTAAGDARAYQGLLNFLNNLTYHQFTRTDLPIGLGAVTECMEFIEGRCKDTVQTLHSNPLQHVILSKDLFLLACGADVESVSLSEGMLRFAVTSPRPEESWFSVGGACSDRVVVSADGRTTYLGMGAYVPCVVPERATFEVRRAGDRTP